MRKTVMRFHLRFALGLWFLAAAGAPALLRGQTPAPPSLGAAASFAVLGGSSVTSTGSTVITGNLGVSPGNAISGSPTVKIGAIYRNDSVARQAQRDATAAYNDLAGRTCTASVSTDLGGMILRPGVYCLSAARLTFAPLILDGANDPNAVWIFRIASTLTTASSVRVINGGHESHIFWQAGNTVTLGADTAFLGNVLALKDIVLGNGASVSGRLLAQGAVSLADNNVSLCCGDITLSPATLPTGIAGTPYAPITLRASGGLEPYIFSISSGKLPDGLRLNDPNPGVISGTPTKMGTSDFTITAVDSHGCTDTQGYVIAISCPTITVTNPEITSGVAGVVFSQTFMQVGAIGTATFTTASLLPAGLMLSTIGVLSGAPTQTGTFPITVIVTDSAGCTATGPTYNLVISCQPIIVTASNPLTPNGKASTSFSQQFSQTGAIGGATFTTTDPLPAGLALSAGGLLSGTPTQTGSFNIVVIVTDGKGCRGMSPPYPLIIGCQTINVTNPVTNAGTVNVAFSQTFSQTGAIGTTTFSTVSTIPAGLGLSASGVLSGTPTQTGTFPIVVKATDSNACTGSGSAYTLTINGPGCSLALSPATLSGATPGFPYNETLTASGGTAPYTFTLSGALPAGLVFTQTTPTTATITGTPTAVGCSTVTVTVTDAIGCTITLTYTICTAAGGPTLSGWGIAALSILLAGVGWVAIRRGG